MASSATHPPIIPPEDLTSFQTHLSRSTRILALLGAGLSASSGLPTFRGAGGLWRTHDAMQLATPEAFSRDPALVWQFYSYRRHMALRAKPNAAHFALAELAKRRGEGLLTLSQNVDGLSPRAGHPPETLKLLHGSLFDLKCSSFFCSHVERDNYTDPIVPALAIPTTKTAENENNGEIDPTTKQALNQLTNNGKEENEEEEVDTSIAASSSSSTSPRDAQAEADANPNHYLDISNPHVTLPTIPLSSLPHCPSCTHGLLRPGVVWFGEMLPADIMASIDAWIEASPTIDLMLVVGTSAKVYPAAGFVDVARAKGARVAVVNVERDVPAGGLAEGDWLFEGDAALVLPELLRRETGEVGVQSI
ncbi:DHS-like NAD/FAD-binding domain-containing protein [Westerdykella ornata]|uniref:DHS-like NAD/FAD-binding domain-containing protein n=1 Tax=Westerdykella ornata TaxID=318751 RepID=A0A6A6JMG9_WESOR|nr:DHS-like NAD/FAD-binding domain-containing protein [Westerdykella ornata]KAF2277148.1 DHS-like NAD/FAD-binding domain-containing protein [Westerdykella ornata]